MCILILFLKRCQSFEVMFLKWNINVDSCYCCSESLDSLLKTSHCHYALWESLSRSFNLKYFVSFWTSIEFSISFFNFLYINKFIGFDDKTSIQIIPNYINDFIDWICVISCSYSNKISHWLFFLCAVAKQSSYFQPDNHLLSAQLVLFSAAVQKISTHIFAHVQQMSFFGKTDPKWKNS